MTQQEGLSSSYYFRILEQKDRENIIDLHQKGFVEGVPVFIAVNLTPDEGLDWLKCFLEDAFEHGVSFGAFHKESNALVAFLLNTLGRFTESHKLVVTENMPLRLKQMTELARILRGDNQSETVGTKDYLDFRALCCDADHCHKGLATELCRRSENIAKQLGVKKICVEAGSYYTERIAKKCGFRRVAEVSFKDYIDPFSGKTIFAGIKEPHTVETFEIKELL